VTWSTVLTELELQHASQMTDNDDDDVVGTAVDCSDAPPGTRRQHIVSVCTAPIKDGGTVPTVDIYITFTGP